MIEYIYFVKCPNCDDEHFDMFDDAKAFACGRLSAKPIITQVEVNRNDFGECVDSNDLGTIWSWEDMMKDIPDETTFSKAETLADGVDYFNEFDDVLDEVPDNFCMPSSSIHEDDQRLATNKNGDFLVAATSGRGYTVYNSHNVCLGGIDCDDEAEAIKRFNLGDLSEVLDRKPVPADMTIEDLVEEMERNENDVECAWCEELFDKSECRYEVDLGWLCGNCEAAIKSRGETLTFREGSNCDLLDEDTDDEALTEAVRVAELAAIPDAKEQIIAAAEQLLGDEARRVIANGAILPTHVYLTGNYGYFTNYYIVDFSIEGENIIIHLEHRQHERDKPTKVTPYAVELQELLSGWKWRRNQDRGLARNNAAYRLLKAIKDAANNLNRQYKPGITQRRDAQVADWLTQMQDKVDLFKLHITNITYEIPQSYNATDLDKTGNPVSEEALMKMDKIYNDFISNDLTPDLARAAIDSGMVADRPTSLDTSHNIAHSWHGNARITFDRYVTELDQELQDIIAASKFRQDGDSSEPSSKKTKTVNNYRLANALIRHFGDIKFYEKPTEPARSPVPAEPELLVASVQKEASHLDTLEEAAAYRERLILCDSCMTPSLDEETGICINCGARATKEAVLTEGYSSWLTDDHKSLLESFIADATAECEQARTAGQHDVHQVVMPWELRDPACKQHLIESLEKAGFPGGQTVSYDDELVFVPLNDKGQGYGKTIEGYYTNN